MEEKYFISVILPLKLEWEPSYYVAESEIGTTIHTGDRVRVRFSGKEYVGVISATDIVPDTEVGRILPVIGIEDNLERITEEEIALWRQVAEYYLCSVGEVYKAAYPIGKVSLEEAKARADARDENRRKKELDSLTSRKSRLEERIEKKRSALERTRKESTAEEYRRQIDLILKDIADIETRIGKLSATGQDKNSGSRAINGCATDCGGHASVIPELSEIQENAYKETGKAFEAHKPVLLHGVTGSGKTEIYIRKSIEVMAEGRNVLYLVPEIALSRQLEDRLEKYFGEKLMTFHSALSAARKREIASMTRSSDKGSGARYIILGTRSSLFLPHRNLGLIIIDEEHDNSYKQDSPAPRYNGRDTALMLSRIHGADVIMGSATPSLESMFNCQVGKHALVRLEHRYHGGLDSEIEIIDTKAERLKRGMRGSFSIRLIQHIKRTISEGGQVMILRSRRSHSTALQCQECGHLQKCPHCNVSISLHRNLSSGNEWVMCHHCGWRSSYTGMCSECGGPVKAFGTGTQKIEEEARELFPEASIARLDSDSAQNKAFEVKTIQDFHEGRTDILIGTQIVSKGFDFSNLRLVAMIAADSLLTLQDFRADEKALQLMEQFRGRCGRRGRKGLFVIQTSQPQHPVYQRILSNEGQNFLNDLMAERKDFGFPPYSRIISITFKDRSESRLQMMASLAGDMIRKVIPQATGPYAPIPDKVADYHIRCIRVCLPKDRQLASRKNRLKKLLADFEKDKSYHGHINVDVDPS